MTHFSEYQERIFEFVESGKGSAVVIAVAGSGKTTTIVECAKRIPTVLYCGFVAFNKSIKEELQTRLPSHVKAQTLNGMGFSAWRKYVGKNLTLEPRKVDDLIYNNISREAHKIYGAGVKKMVSLAKAYGIVPEGLPGVHPLMYDTEENWFNLMETYGVEFEGATSDPRIGIDFARQILRMDIEMGEKVIDFSDQMYLPVIHRVKFWQNDWLFVDEAQDVNHVQRAMLKMGLRPGGRLIAVGDPHQAIYGFRGADTDSIENIKKDFGAVELPLSISYRCPQAVVKEAQRFVSHIQPSPTAPKGKVGSQGAFNSTLFNPTDAIVCRNTAPLIDLAYKILRQKMACRVLGREIGQGLVNLIKKMKASNIEELETRLYDFFARESAKLLASGKETQAGALEDKIATIKIFIEHLLEPERSVERLVQNIESLFTDNDKGLLTLCTIHKSKGLEWTRVFVLNPELMPSKYARQEWQLGQERNLQYVAVTRAKSELIYLSLKSWAEGWKKEAVA